MSTQIKSSLLVILGVFLIGFGLGYTFVQNKWDEAKLEYQQDLQNTKDMYDQQLEDLYNYNDSIECKIKAVTYIIDSLNTSIANRTKALDSLKQEYEEQIDHIDNMSHNELVEFFANRY